MKVDENIHAAICISDAVILEGQWVSLVSVYNVPLKERPRATGTLPTCYNPSWFMFEIAALHLARAKSISCKKKKEEERIVYVGC